MLKLWNLSIPEGIVSFQSTVPLGVPTGALPLCTAPNTELDLKTTAEPLLGKLKAQIFKDWEVQNHED